MKPEDFPEPEVQVWDDNWLAITLFLTYSSQWRVGMAGPIGLDFNVIHHALDRKGITGEAFEDTIEDMKIIEATALKMIHKS
jgi:hypothetical protein